MYSSPPNKKKGKNTKLFIYHDLYHKCSSPTPKLKPETIAIYESTEHQLLLQFHLASFLQWIKVKGDSTVLLYVGLGN